MSWVILQHVAWEGPGLIAAEARSRGLQFEILRLDTGVVPPSFERVNGLVVMGGPMGVYETNKFPFLTQEVRLIENLIRRSRPVLGACLGAQLLAHALGARVFRGKEPEIGFGSVELTQEGTKDVVMGASGPLLPRSLCFCGATNKNGPQLVPTAGHGRVQDVYLTTARANPNITKRPNRVIAHGLGTPGLPNSVGC